MDWLDKTVQVKRHFLKFFDDAVSRLAGILLLWDIAARSGEKSCQESGFLLKLPVYILE